VVGDREIDNLSMARIVAGILEKPLNYELVDFHGSRPGHDLRYALDGTKMKRLGWHSPRDFDDSLIKTIEWYLKDENKKWLTI
jgi:dTDP-glucose 4,6-dehydratase